MKYQNTKTGFIFDSDCECTGEDWVKLEASPAAPLEAEIPEEAKEEPKKELKEKPKKRTKK